MPALVRPDVQLGKSSFTEIDGELSASSFQVSMLANQHVSGLLYKEDPAVFEVRGQISLYRCYVHGA